MWTSPKKQIPLNSLLNKWGMNTEFWVGIIWVNRAIGSFNLGYGYGFNLSDNHNRMGGHTFTIRYTHQFLKKNIERKVKEFNIIFRKDYQRLKEIGLDLAQ